MFGGNEIFIIIIIVILIFGMKNASQIGKGLGKSLQSFKRAAKGIDEIDITPIHVDDGEYQEEENRDTKEA